MRIVDSLCKLYGSWVIAQESIGNCEVVESDKGAKFVKLSITNAQSPFFVINRDVYVKNFNFGKDAVLNNLNCDGVAITEIDNKITCVFSELKSSLDSKDIFKAHKQIISTFIKFSILMSLSKDFNADFQYIGIIGSRPVKDKSQEDSFKLELLNIQEGYFVDNDKKCLVELWKERLTKRKISDFAFLKDYPLNKSIGNKEITIYLSTADSYAENSGVFDLGLVR